MFCSWICNSGRALWGRLISVPYDVTWETWPKTWATSPRTPTHVASTLVLASNWPFGVTTSFSQIRMGSTGKHTNRDTRQSSRSCITLWLSFRSHTTSFLLSSTSQSNHKGLPGSKGSAQNLPFDGGVARFWNCVREEKYYHGNFWKIQGTTEF